jgi:hypothetical protein
MKAKAIRLPQDLLDALKYTEKKEKLDEPTVLRKLLRLGTERYVGTLYARGEITLWDASRVLKLPLRETLEIFLDMGIAGNVSAAQAMKAIAFLKKTKG